MTRSPAATSLVLILTTALAPIVWGTPYLVATQVLPEGRPLTAGLLRALPAGLVALAWTRTLPRGAWWWKSTVLGALNIGVFFPLLFCAAGRLPGGVAATLGSIQPLIVASLAALLLSERTSRWQLGWAVAGAVGVGLVVVTAEARLDPLGIAAGLAGAASMALGVVLSKRWGRPDDVSAMGYAGWLLTAGGVVLLPVTLLTEGPPTDVDGHAVGGYLWLGLVGGLIAYTVWFRGVRLLPATPTALLGLLSPLTAATLGVLVLDESFTPLQSAGFAAAVFALGAAHLPAGLIIGRNTA